MSVSFTTLTTTLEGAVILVEGQMDADYLIGPRKGPARDRDTHTYNRCLMLKI